MKRTVLSLLAVATAAGVVAAWAQTSRPTEVKPGTPSAKEIRGASPYAEIKNEACTQAVRGPTASRPPGSRCRLDPVAGGEREYPSGVRERCAHVSPRVGHLHVHVDDVPWWWADASNINTIDLAGLTPGPHKIRVVLVDANHEPFPGQSKTVTFTIPKGTSRSHSH